MKKYLRAQDAIVSFYGIRAESLERKALTKMKIGYKLQIV